VVYKFCLRHCEFEWLAYAELCATTALLLALPNVASFSLDQISLWEQQQLQLMCVWNLLCE